MAKALAKTKSDSTNKEPDKEAEAMASEEEQSTEEEKAASESDNTTDEKAQATDGPEAAVDKLVRVYLDGVAPLGESEEAWLVMDEPSLELDFEKWSGWFDGLKQKQLEIRTFMESAGVPPLPVAVKGLGWGEAPTSGKDSGARHRDCAVLHHACACACAGGCACVCMCMRHMACGMCVCVCVSM